MHFSLLKSSVLIAAIGISTTGLLQAQTIEPDVHTAEAKQGQYVATVASLGIEQPWSRALPPTANVGATFVNIYNQGEADRLISAHADIAEKTELHTHIHQDGMMKMVQVEAIDVPAQGHLALKPGSYHIMLVGLKQPLREGERFPIRLTFEQAGSVDLQVEVKSPNAGTAVERMSDN